MTRFARTVSLLSVSLTLLFSVTISRADQSAPELDSLFDLLVDARTTPSEAREVTSQIWRLWLQTNNNQAQELMDLGVRKMSEYALEEAIEIFSDLI